MNGKTVTPEIASDIANLFDALSDPTRILIINALLEKEGGVGELVTQLGLTKSAVSYQFRGLCDKRLIRPRKQGRNVFVCIDDALTDGYIILKVLEHGRTYISTLNYRIDRPNRHAALCNWRCPFTGEYGKSG